MKIIEINLEGISVYITLYGQEQMTNETNESSTQQRNDPIISAADGNTENKSLEDRK